MARVKLTEYRAKAILLGEGYGGISIGQGSNAEIPEGVYVAKVDEGVKKRMKRGLVALKVGPKEIREHAEKWGREGGFSTFIAEPFLPHEASEERYLSLERVRAGIRVMYAEEGGIDIEEH